MQAPTFIGKLALAFGTSTVLAESLSLEPLWTALITFGVSVVTLVGGEIIKWLVAYFKKKTHDIEEQDNKEHKEN